MEARLQRRVQRYGWDRAAGIYENAWRAQLAPAQTLLLDMAHLRLGEVVLDVACGTGLITLPAAAAVEPGGSVLGTDISGRMVEEATVRAAVAGVGNVSYRRMDGEVLELPDEAFDAALCGLGLMYMPRPEVALREMTRVLKPGGRLVAAVWGERGNCGWAEIFPIVDRRVASEVCPLFFRLGTNDLLAEILMALGLKDVVSRRLSSTLHFDDDESAVTAALYGGPVALAASRFDEIDGKAAAEEYLASIEPYRNGKAYEIPGEFVVAVGWKS